jgi:large subunit ribosomal protein L29
MQAERKVKLVKTNQLNELREMSGDELQVKLSEMKAELFNLRFQQATNQLSNPMRIVEVRHNIARIKTILREEELKESV